MPTQSDFPDKWVCQSEDKQAIVEVRSPNGEDVEAELFVNVLRLDEGDAFVYVETVDRPTPTLSELFVNIQDGSGESLWGLSIRDFTYNFEERRYEALVDGENLDVPDNEALTATTNGAVSFEWIEIPTMEVELWVEKGEAAARQKTAKVKYPTEWGDSPDGDGHNSPRQLIENFEPEDSSPFMFGRVKMRDENGQFVIQHLGWIGGVGAAEGNNRSKLWIYDFAEFFSGVPAGETFNNPTVQQAVSKILSLTQEETAIPVAGSTIIAPETEEEFTKLAEGSVRTGDIAGVSQRLISDSDTVVYGLAGIDKGFAIEDGEVIGEGVLTKDDFGSIIIDTQEGKFIPFEPDSKHFTANHDTLLDVLTWFEQKSQAKVHFEPMPQGTAVQMVFDIEPSRRTFADREVIAEKERQGESIDFHEPVHVTKNTALYEIKPQNTVHLRGSYPQGIVDDVWDGVSGALSVLPGNDGPPPEKYPVVKAQSPALLEAANGVEVSGEVVESDAKSLEDAEKEAIQTLSETLSETSTGEVVMYGAPRLLPYDKVVAYEVCNNQVQYEQQPVQYEVQSVKHTASANDPYLTRISVSIWANDKNIEITESKMVEVEN
jgi:hypothetical protein